MRLPVAIDLPFHIGSDGGIATTHDAGRQIRQRIVTVVGTEPTERVMLPQFGVPVNDYLFEMNEEIVTNELTDLTRQQMAWWEPGVIVNTVEPVTNDDQSIALVDITYLRTDAPDTADNLARSVHYASIDRNGRMREVIRG